MATALDLIKDAMDLIGVLSSGEAPSGADAVDGLRALNRMIDGWSIEGLLIFENVREEFALVPGQATYTMGPGGDFDTTRPVQINGASLLVPNGTVPIEMPIGVLTPDQWASLAMKSMASPLVTTIYPSGSFPLETINVWPVPNTAHDLVIYSKKALTAFASTGTQVQLPPGYETAIVSNLAILRAPAYRRPVTDDVRLLAARSKGALAIANSKTHHMDADDATRGNRRSFNIITGE